ncbi:acetyl-CoA carboxylase carboxyltransferase subunit [Kordiimonas sediminis]|uniref:Acetyl-CoA carboxylase carboxyltransferase subunit n=1 Tax=Kordiimonas sediminis TaxID=1735581 RepID=A0A919EAT4_9PROT|nr:carboxyl transferase domain-containing protein [Kordiimonas sediminis]GHF31175.1 acetyl-CoA carboxylase carboxyltransferase subunit [Kordiimonas sediminis]
MAVFSSTIRTDSPSFQENRQDMLALIDKLNELNKRAPEKSESRKPTFDKRGQLTPRARLARLLDPGMPFLQIGNIAGYMVDTKKEEKSIAGSTIFSGIGFISGVRCVIVVDDSGIQAGAMTEAGGYRLRRAEEIALKQKMPFIHLVESAGGDLLNYTVEGFLIGGSLFANLARLSKAGIPVISVLHGSSTAGGAYMPGLSDYVIAVKGRGKAFLAGPPLLKAATGEIATDEELGGAEMHATISGLAEYLVDDDAEAMIVAREVVDRLGWNESAPSLPSQSYEEPLYDPDEIAGVVPIDYRKPYEAREVIARIVDGSDFTDFKPGYGVSTVCVQASVYGQKCAIVANNGPIDPDGATKTAQFLQLMDQAGTPVVFLQNTTGYLVGKQYEQAGMIKHGSKMIQAVTNISVPRITFMIGASFGAGNYGMCGRGYDPDFVYSWPNAMTGVMGGDQAATVMSIVAKGQAAARGVPVDEEALKNQEAYLKHVFDSQAGAFYTSGHMLDDGMIDPRDTRRTLGLLLATVREGWSRDVRENSFGIARM